MSGDGRQEVTCLQNGCDRQLSVCQIRCIFVDDESIEQFIKTNIILDQLNDVARKIGLIFSHSRLTIFTYQGRFIKP